MSEKTTPHVITSLPETEQETNTETPKLRFAKTRQFVKDHKKPAIAVGALVGLVALASVTGKKQATVVVQSPLELEIEDVTDEESTDTQSA